MKQSLCLAAFVCAALAGPAFGQSASGTTASGLGETALTDITANQGTIWEIKHEGATTQGFFKIHNDGKSVDTLTSWNCSLAKATNLVGADGKSLQSLVIPPGRTVVLSAKGPHLVLISPRDTIVPGSIIPCGLAFQNQGDVGVMLYAVPHPK